MKKTITMMSQVFTITAMKIIIISMGRTMRQDMLNPIDTIVMMIRTMNAHRLPMTIFPIVQKTVLRIE